MTVNEVEQAIRNLMLSQPMINAGPMGGVVNSAVAILESYRNFAISVQNYPVQDNLKFSLMSELQRLENNITMSVCQSFQEKGVNIMAFMMPTQAGMMPQFAPQNQAQGTHSHLAFNQAPPPNRFGGNNRPMGGGQFAPQQFQQGMMPPPPQYPQQQMPNGGMMQQQQMPNGGMMPPPPMPNRPIQGPMPNRPMAGSPYGAYPQAPNQAPKPQAPQAYPQRPAQQMPPRVGAVQMNSVQKAPPVQEVKESEIPKPVVQPSKASIKTQEFSTAKPAVTKSSSKKPAMLQGFDGDDGSASANASESAPAGSAAGRDYLLQLLKK